MEYQPNVVGRHLSLLMGVMNWQAKGTDVSASLEELDDKIRKYEMQSKETLTESVKNGVILKGLGTFPEIQKHLLKNETYNETKIMTTYIEGLNNCIANDEAWNSREKCRMGKPKR